MWNDLAIRVLDAEAAVHENCPSQVEMLSQIRRFHRQPQMRITLHHRHGCVKPGEMLLANQRLGYSEVKGNVWPGSMIHKKVESYPG